MKNKYIVGTAFPSCPHKRESYVKITSCHYVLSRDTFSSDKWNLIFGWYTSPHMCPINCTNTILTKKKTIDNMMSLLTNMHTSIFELNTDNKNINIFHNLKCGIYLGFIAISRGVFEKLGSSGFMTSTANKHTAARMTRPKDWCLLPSAGVLK